MSQLSTQPIQGDAQLIFSRMISFSGGMVSKARANLIQDNEFSDGQNIDIDEYGNAVTRRGVSALGTAPTSAQIMGAYYFDTPSLERVVEASGTGIYDYDNSSWSGLVSGYTASSTDLQIEFAQIANNLYWVDGAGEAHRYDGTTITASSAWGVSDAPPDAAKYLIEHQNRLAMAGSLSGVTYPDQTIYFSDNLSAEFPVLNAVTVSGGDGDPIRGLFSWVDYNLLCFKERSIFLVDTSAGYGSSATTARISSMLGTVSQRSICQVGQDVFFLAKDGVRSVQQTIQDGQNEVGLPKSFPINDWIQRINWAHVHKSCAVFWNNRYFLSVPIDSSTTPNYTLVYHVVNKSWCGYWTGWSPKVYVISAFSGDTRLNFGDNTGNLMQWRDFVKTADEISSDFEDDGSDIASNITTKAFIFGDYNNPKIGDYCECEFLDSDANVNIEALINSSTSETSLKSDQISYNSDAGFTFPITLPFIIGANNAYPVTCDLMSLGEFRELQLKVSATAGKISLRSITAGAYMRGLTVRS